MTTKEIRQKLKKELQSAKESRLMFEKLIRDIVRHKNQYNYTIIADGGTVNITGNNTLVFNEYIILLDGGLINLIDGKCEVRPLKSPTIRN